VTSHKSPVSLQTRVDVATGLVVVGDLVGSGEAQERGIVGETPNLAARLQGIAEPNAVIIAESTRKLLGNLFELEDLGAKDLSGISGLVRAWAALRPSAVESRFEALHASGPTEFVGREEEIELLLRRWSKAKIGEGQVCCCPVRPVLANLDSRQRCWSALRMSRTRACGISARRSTRTALFFPFIAQLEHAAGVNRDDAVEAKLGKLRALLVREYRMTTICLSFSPQRKREKLLEALLKQLESEARRRPLLIAFEDAHWIDPTSRELLDLTVDRVRRLPVLLAITFRPEFQPPWSGRSYVASLTLNRLDECNSETLVQNLAGDAALNADTVADIVARTDGCRCSSRS
jgi:hypothetical protein